VDDEMSGVEEVGEGVDELEIAFEGESEPLEIEGSVVRASIKGKVWWILVARIFLLEEGVDGEISDLGEGEEGSDGEGGLVDLVRFQSRTREVSSILLEPDRNVLYNELTLLEKRSFRALNP